MNWDDGLTQAQCQAVSHRGAHACLLAGPGTGKTLVLTRRVLYLVREHNVDAGDIQVLTFTRAAARELRDRVHSELDSGGNGVAISTLHSFALKNIL